MDPLSITCGVITVGGLALTSSVQLYNIIHDLQTQNKKTRALQNELSALKIVLETLLDTVNASDPDVDFSALEDPLQQCNEACKTYSQLITKFTKHTTSTRPSIRDWFKQQYYWGDVTDFKEMISAYKATITIAIVNVNIRLTTSIKQDSLDDYKHLMSNTTEDLREHLHDINDRISSLSCDEPNDEDPNSEEWRALLAEKRCAQQGLEFCAQLSSEIARLEPDLLRASGEATAPIAREYLKNGVDVTKGSIQAMESKLQSHKDEMGLQILANPSYQTQVAAELADLQRSKDGMEKCIQLISQAEERAAVIERRNMFEDINLSESSVNITVSTVGDLVTTRRVTISGGSVNIGGQIGNAELAAAFEGLGMMGRAAYSPTYAAGKDVKAAAAGQTRFEQRQNMGNTLEKSAEEPRATGKSIGDGASSSRRGTVTSGVVMCESVTASSPSRTML